VNRSRLTHYHPPVEAPSRRLCPSAARRLSHCPIASTALRTSSREAASPRYALFWSSRAHRRAFDSSPPSLEGAPRVAPRRPWLMQARGMASQPLVMGLALVAPPATTIADRSRSRHPESRASTSTGQAPTCLIALLLDSLSGMNGR